MSELNGDMDINVLFPLGGFVLTFLNVLLKGLQVKTIAGNNYRSAFIISCNISFIEIAIISVVTTTIVKHGVTAAIPMALGAGCGVVTSMFLYNKVFSKSK